MGEPAGTHSDMKRRYFDAIEIRFSAVFASFDLGNVMESTPFSNLAEILSSSTLSGSSKARRTEP